MSRSVHWCVWLTVVVCAVSVAPAEEPLPDAAIEAIAAEQWQTVLEQLSPLADAAERPTATYWVGVAQLATGERGRAGQTFHRLLEARPWDPAAARMLSAVAARSGGDYHSRLPEYVRGLAELRPHDGEAAQAVAQACMNKYLWKLREGGLLYGGGSEAWLKRAIEGFRRAEKLGARGGQGDRWLAFLLYRDRRYEEALPYAYRAASREAAGYEAYLILGGCLMNVDRPAAADAAFAEARALAPGKAPLIEYERGKALFAAGRYNEAVEAFRIVLDKSWPQENVRHWIGISAFRARRYRLALWALFESHTVDARTDSLYFIGRCAYDVGQYTDAEEYLRRAVDELAEKRAAQGSDRPPPAEWTHYLGRALWGLDRREEALERLEDAFARNRDNALYARWLYRAHLAQDDLESAIDVTLRFGKAGNERAAIETLHLLLKRWPRPRLQDFGKKPHVFIAWDAIAELHYRLDEYHTAVHYWHYARRLHGPAVRTRPCWALLRCGELERAERGFRDCIRRYKNKDYGRLGLGCTYMAMAQWSQATDMLGAIEKESMLPGRDAGLLYAAVAGGRAKAHELADPYTLLGMVRNSQRGAGRGEEIAFIIPGGLLDAAEPALRPGDVVVQVAGLPLGTDEQNQALRDGKIPDEPVEAVIRRGDARFMVTLDYPAAVSKLPDAGEMPAGAEEAHP
jgi:tetratricopeptide (TPR) repeat protein